MRRSHVLIAAPFFNRSIMHFVLKYLDHYLLYCILCEELSMEYFILLKFYCILKYLGKKNCIDSDLHETAKVWQSNKILSRVSD
jgi:hypothetical protein